MIKELRKANPDMLLVDAGNAARGAGWMEVIEYKYLASGYQQLGYQILNFGLYEQNVPEDDLKKIIEKHKDLPYISANITYSDKTRFAKPYKVLDYKGIKVGFMGVSDYFRSHKHYDIVDFDKAIEKYLPELKKESDVQILLASIDEVDARKIAEKFPEFEVIFFGGSTTEFHSWKDSSLYGPFGLGKDKKAPWILREGEVGRFQLVIKLKYKEGDLSNVEAEDIELTDKYKNDPDMNKYIFKTMEDEIKKENQAKMGVYGPPGDNDFTSAIDCADPECHEEQFKAWEKSEHANAYISLTKDKRGNVFDPDKNPRCIKCHTLGFTDPDGGFLSSYDIPESRKGVSCGNCHGKARTHMERAFELSAEGKLIDIDIFPEIRRPDITTCIKCHDAENDNHFFDQNEDTKGNFKHKLKEISETKDHKHFNFDRSWSRYIKSSWVKKYGKFDKKE